MLGVVLTAKVMTQSQCVTNGQASCILVGGGPRQHIPWRWGRSGHPPVNYNWITPPVHEHKKSIPEQTRRATTVRDHVRKTLGKENPDLLGSSLCKPFLTPFFKITFQITSESK